MKIGIIAPSKLNEKNKKIILEVVKRLTNHEIYLVPDKGSVSEFFAQNYLEQGGKKLFSVIPLDDKEFGYEWVNTELGEKINCGTWRNQPEKLNEETEALVCLGYSAGGLIEMGYTKWFNKKPIYIIKELVSEELPKEIKLDFKYLPYNDLNL